MSHKYLDPLPDDPVTVLVNAGLYVRGGASHADMVEIVRREVRLSVERAGRVDPAPGVDKMAADIRKAARLLAPYKYPVLLAIVEQLNRFRIEPGLRTNKLKWRCAKEALDLVTILTEAEITTQPSGPVYQLALLIYRANVSDPDDEDMSNVIEMVVEKWKAMGCPQRPVRLPGT
jgi:hypothetical protein